MTWRPHRLLAAAALAVAAACAHAPAARRPPPDVAWPAPPAPPRLRLLALVPDPDAPPPRKSFWRRVADAVTGLDSARRRETLLARPFGVAVGPDGALFVADPDGAAVLRFDGDGRVTRVACRGREWTAPIAVALGARGELLVADAGAGEIVVVEAAGCRALARGALERPTGIAVSGERLLVVDPPRHEVVTLSPGGEVLARLGARGEGEGEFHFPTAIAAAPDGSVLVVDALNFRIVRLSGDGRWLGAFGAPGGDGSGFARPKGVATDASGRVYVTDAQRDAVLVFGADGAFQYAAGATGTDPGRFALPAGVAVSGDRLYVADSHNRRVQVFQLVGDST